MESQRSDLRSGGGRVRQLAPSTLGGGHLDERWSASTRAHYGKGPVRCRTYVEPELVTVVLGEGYTAAEQTMFEAGRWHEVRSARQIWQDSMRGAPSSPRSRS